MIDSITCRDGGIAKHWLLCYVRYFLPRGTSKLTVMKLLFGENISAMTQDAASFVVSRFAATAKVFTPPTILLLGRPPDTQSSWRWFRESESSKTLASFGVLFLLKSVTQRILLGILTREWGYSYTRKSWDWGVNHPKWLFQRDF